VLSEKTFASDAQRIGFRDAFLKYIADDGVLFRPGPVNGKKFLSEQKDSPELIVWNPTFADISSNGILGYTTGDYEYFPEGREKGGSSNGQYFSIWQKQSDGNFKVVLDIGIGHGKPKSVSSDWKSPADTGKNLNERKLSAGDSAIRFFEGAEKFGLAKAYKLYAAEDIRMLRDGEFPITGRKNALASAKKNQGAIRFGKRTNFFSTADLAYTSNSYEIIRGSKTEKGNFVQVWKLRGAMWQIVLDVFSPVR